MAKIKLSKLVKDYLQERKHRDTIKQEMKLYVQKMDVGLNKLRNLMRKDGYNV